MGQRMQTRKRKGRSLTASQVLMNPAATPRPWWKRFGVSTAEPLLLRESNGENIHGWPLRASEYLTLSPAHRQKLVEQERQKPTLNKLYTRLRARQRFAIWETEDLDTCFRLLDEAELEYMRPQISHYQRLRQLNAPNLQRTNKTDRWHDQARQRADEALKKPGIHRNSSRQLSMKLCGVDDWDAEAKFIFNFTKGKKTHKAKVSADRLSRFLSREYSFPHSK
jgi:hypothetical protein